EQPDEMALAQHCLPCPGAGRPWRGAARSAHHPLSATGGLGGRAGLAADGATSAASSEIRSGDHRLARAPGGTTQGKMDGQRPDAQQSGIDLAAARPHAAALVPDAVSALRGAMAVEPPELLSPASLQVAGARPGGRQKQGPAAGRSKGCRVRDSAEWRPAPGPDRWRT